MSAIDVKSLADEVNLDLDHRVEVRKTDKSQWRLRSDFRCDMIRNSPLRHQATLTYSGVNVRVPIEKLISEFNVGDQVRVWIYDNDSEYVNSDGLRMTKLFDGIVTRPRSEVTPNGHELFQLYCDSIVDTINALPRHRVTGRWYDRRAVLSSTAVDDLPVLVTLTGPSQRCIFNHRGPNAARMISEDDTLEVLDPYSSLPVTAKRFMAFTYDGDANASFWTVGQAIWSLYLMGLAGTASEDDLLWERETLAALEAIQDQQAVATDQHKGLDTTLPEVDVHGMGVLEAMAKVADAGGFDLFAESVPQPGKGDYNNAKGYRLRLVRKHSGPARTLRLDRQGSTYGDHEDFARANNITNLRLLRDGREIINEVLATGNLIAEARFELVPFWSEYDFAEDGQTATADLQLGADSEKNDTYLSRHVAGGGNFAAYGHVGRVWGLATNDAEVDAYNSGNNAVSIFDFVTQLGLGTDLAFAGQTGQPIVMSSRPRPMLPLRSPQARREGIKYYIEISEDSGSTWHHVQLQAQPVAGSFAIALTGLRNLASINLAAIRDNSADVVASESWWAKILDQSLKVRVTCCIELDFAETYYADRRGTSGTPYRRSELLETGFERLIVWPGTPYNLGSSHRVYEDADGFSAAVDERTWFNTINPNPRIKAVADQRRDALEDCRISASTTLLTIKDYLRESYRLGDRISKVSGREIDLTTNHGTAKRAPVVRGIDINLMPGRQGATLHLDDRAITEGIRPGAMEVEGKA